MVVLDGRRWLLQCLVAAAVAAPVAFVAVAAPVAFVAVATIALTSNMLY